MTFKIVSSVLLSLLVSCSLSFWITQNRVASQAEQAFVDKLRMLTDLAGGSRLGAGQGSHPWEVAQRYAHAEGYTFRKPARSPLSPDDVPDEFETRAFAALESRAQLKHYAERVTVNGRQEMRYVRPVAVSKDCQSCHASWTTDDETHPASSNAGVRHLDALFSITAPLDALAANERSNAVAVFLISLATLLISSVTVCLLIRRLLIRPLRAANSLARSIANNDLQVGDIPVQSQDEMGQTAAALNLMKNNLRSAIEEVTLTAERLASATEEISANTTQAAAGAETQRDQVSQVATAMQEMAATVLEISGNSTKASECAQQAAQTAHGGGGIVDDTLTTIRSISMSVRDTAVKIAELGKSSDRIGKIVNVIDDIADQTNLLALNAAIEAARAGEQGRGFAVVADEVRKLAERTTKATKEIAEMIAKVQSETGSAVKDMELGTEQVEEGVAITSRAGESLKEIIGQAEQVGAMIAQIATAATQQSATNEHVNSRLEEIGKSISESASGAEQSAKACGELSNLATELEQLVRKFRLGDSGKPRPQPEPQHLAPKQAGPIKRFRPSSPVRMQRMQESPYTSDSVDA
ncbi:MAG: methyl-accepting chemotaxis protein [Acidobacteriia bacterium]|nr:methyl-accepting chemotaxis protein [Terriglobia bacterium]